MVQVTPGTASTVFMATRQGYDHGLVRWEVRERGLHPLFSPPLNQTVRGVEARQDGDRQQQLRLALPHRDGQTSACMHTQPPVRQQRV